MSVGFACGGLDCMPLFLQIHKWAPHIQANDEMKERLSPEEAQLHGAICKYREAYLNDIVLSQLPEGYNSLEGKGSEGPPDQVHVFARIQEDLGSIPSGEEAGSNEGDELRAAPLHYFYRFVSLMPLPRYAFFLSACRPRRHA